VLLSTRPSGRRVEGLADLRLHPTVYALRGPLEDTGRTWRLKK